ncbi:MAG: zinc dependent phospholipase C family protein, partial [Acutalibacter sp.]|nr:zinc dependent phospholipase C family protein [Acutalibacter sp.]
MHLVLAQELLKDRELSQPEAFLFGALLPDAPRPPAGKAGNRASHFLADRGPLRTYDLDEFRQLYGERLREEGLYLGYYLHLIQDIVYRRFQHGKWAWGKLSKEQFTRLYQDYSLLNDRFICQYRLENKVKIPKEVEEEDICRRFFLRTGELLEQVEEDFRRERAGEPEEPV